MKTQMRFQKILMLITLIMAALTIVYSFAFATGSVSSLYYMQNASAYKAASSDAYYLAWTINDVLLYLGIVFVVLVAINYLFANGKNRNYYKSNYITLIATIAYMFVFAIVGIILVSLVFSACMSIPAETWESFKTYCESRSFDYYHYDNTWFFIGYVVYFLVIVNAVLLTLSLVWKIKLMKGEKKLLEGGIAKEAA